MHRELNKIIAATHMSESLSFAGTKLTHSATCSESDRAQLKVLGLQSTVNVARLYVFAMQPSTAWWSVRRPVRVSGKARLSLSLSLGNARLSLSGPHI